MAPFSAFAASGDYEAMVLACIDPRLQEPYAKWTAAQGLTGSFGIGLKLFNYIQQRDYGAVQGIVTILAIVVIVTSLLIDIVNALIDPRVRY